jgi:hypothetical protein
VVFQGFGELPVPFVLGEVSADMPEISGMCHHGAASFPFFLMVTRVWRIIPGQPAEGKRISGDKGNNLPKGLSERRGSSGEKGMRQDFSI